MFIKLNVILPVMGGGGVAEDSARISFAVAITYKQEPVAITVKGTVYITSLYRNGPCTVRNRFGLWEAVHRGPSSFLVVASGQEGEVS